MPCTPLCWKQKHNVGPLMTQKQTKHPHRHHSPASLLAQSYGTHKHTQRNKRFLRSGRTVRVYCPDTDLDGAGVLGVVQQADGAAELSLQAPHAAAHQSTQHVRPALPLPQPQPPGPLCLSPPARGVTPRAPPAHTPAAHLAS